MEIFFSRAVIKYLAFTLMVCLLAYCYVGWPALMAWVLAAAGLFCLGRTVDAFNSKPPAPPKQSTKKRRRK